MLNELKAVGRVTLDVTVATIAIALWEHFTGQDLEAGVYLSVIALYQIYKWRVA